MSLRHLSSFLPKTALSGWSIQTPEVYLVLFTGFIETSTLFLQPVSQVLHLSSDATLGCASGGAVLLDTAPVVPNRGHILTKQRAA